MPAKPFTRADSRKALATTMALYGNKEQQAEAMAAK